MDSQSSTITSTTPKSSTPQTSSNIPPTTTITTTPPSEPHSLLEKKQQSHAAMDAPSEARDLNLERIMTSLSVTSDSIYSLSNAPSTPATDVADYSQATYSDESRKIFDAPLNKNVEQIVPTAENVAEIAKQVGQVPGVQRLQSVCCGGGCCQKKRLPKDLKPSQALNPPVNDAYRSLNLNVDQLSLDSALDDIVDLPPQTVDFFSKLPADAEHTPNPQHPPKFVTPHPPYEVYGAKIHHARALTKPGAEKRTYHFDLDVTDYPVEGGTQFIVGGAVGVCAPNEYSTVEEILDLLHIPRRIRDKPITLKTAGGRWPTIWGEEEPRELVATRRELLTWCVDIQSSTPTKQLLRILAEYADDPEERKILFYLCSAQGQAAFCDLRTGCHISLVQLLYAFPSSKPSLPHLLCNLPFLMPRFYSLSNDPHISSQRCNGTDSPRKLIEMAVTVHESDDWRSGYRTGVGSGFMERQAEAFIKAEKEGIPLEDIEIRIPMFRGLMSNPLAKQFANDGPMLLIGAGVGIAPFRGFVQRRLLSANCANKVWVLQGIRDSLVDELYKGEWGVEEEHVKRVIESRTGTKQYVQDEVRHQADLVWFIINATDGRVFVCGSSKGMGEGVESALVEVAMEKARLRREEAVEFWEKKKEAGQYIAETW